MAATVTSSGAHATVERPSPAFNGASSSLATAGVHQDPLQAALREPLRTNAAFPPRTQAHAPASEARGFIIRARRASSAVCIVGTTHYGRAEAAFFPIHRRLVQLIGSAPAVHIDIDPIEVAASPRTRAGVGVYASGDSLDRHAPLSLMHRLRPMTQRWGGLARGAIIEKPWLAAEMVLALGLRDRGWYPESGAGSVIHVLARSMGRPVSAIETRADRIGQLEAMPEGLQIECLADAIQDVETGRADAVAWRCLKAWQAGDLGRLAQVVDTDFAHAPGWPAFRRSVLIDGRSLRLTNAIERIALGSPDASRERPAVVVVRCLHLPGENGLLALLKRRGFQLDEFPSARAGGG